MTEKQVIEYISFSTTLSKDATATIWEAILCSVCFRYFQSLPSEGFELTIPFFGKIVFDFGGEPKAHCLISKTMLYELSSITYKLDFERPQVLNDSEKIELQKICSMVPYTLKETKEFFYAYANYISLEIYLAVMKKNDHVNLIIPNIATVDLKYRKERLDNECWTVPIPEIVLNHSIMEMKREVSRDVIPSVFQNMESSIINYMEEILGVANG